MTLNPVITKWTCEHPTQVGATIVGFVKRPDPKIANPSEWQAKDWEFTLKFLGKRLDVEKDLGWRTYPAHLEVVQLCSDCFDRLPSVQHRVEQQRQKEQKPPATEEVRELQEFLEQVEAGDPLYFCYGCDEFKDEGDLVPLRECPHCEVVFDGNEGRNCPECNRPFSRNLELDGCPDCLDSENLPEPATVGLIQGMMPDTSPQTQMELA